MYKYPSPLATHIVDGSGNTVMDVPLVSNDEAEWEWRTRRELIIDWLNSGKICIVNPPVRSLT